jgi:hypothetical protein
VVLPGLQGKGIVRQRSLSAEAFLVTFVATYGEAILSTYKKQTTTKNVTGPPAAKSGYAICNIYYLR